MRIVRRPANNATLLYLSMFSLEERKGKKEHIDKTASWGRSEKYQIAKVFATFGSIRLHRQIIFFHCEVFTGCRNYH